MIFDKLSNRQINRQTQQEDFESIEDSQRSICSRLDFELNRPGEEHVDGLSSSK